ncbi:hypothetical protein SAMN04489725_10813 [Alicyclobacillus hesperidum]|uniref:Uncharacterized protein n=1 Tax=Alicyclobacillus hesperidum TaxID=89784 RepID=A0A1H2UIZ6_9BACL|nr:hypothetical protein SAMN04489725_10813 [Alicyclobacillus hesperidum]
MYDMAKHQRPPHIVANERCTKQAQVHNSHGMRKDAVIRIYLRPRSQAIYGCLVETAKPYSWHYTSLESRHHSIDSLACRQLLKVVIEDERFADF